MRTKANADVAGDRRSSRAAAPASQGRDADAPQHPGERRRHRARSIELTADDVLVGVLPFFHSFGFTGTLWLPLARRLRRRLSPESDGRQDHRRAGRASYHGDDAHQHADVLRRLHPQVHARAVRAPALRHGRRREAARADRGGVQGEVRHRRCSKATAAPRWRRSWRSTCRTSRTAASASAATRVGSVGHPLPGVVAKIVDPATGEGPLFGQEGLLLVKGPNRMQGYLGEPEKTRRSAARRLVRHRRHRADRRGRLHPDHRSAVALQQDRRRDGAAHEGRGADPGAARTRSSPAS